MSIIFILQLHEALNLASYLVVGLVQLYLLPPWRKLFPSETRRVPKSF